MWTPGIMESLLCALRNGVNLKWPDIQDKTLNFVRPEGRKVFSDPSVRSFLPLSFFFVEPSSKRMPFPPPPPPPPPPLLFLLPPSE